MTRHFTKDAGFSGRPACGAKSPSPKTTTVPQLTECSNCQRMLAKGILSLDPQTGATVLTKYVTHPCAVNPTHLAHPGACK